jgi:hypothetical protein
MKPVILFLTAAIQAAAVPVAPSVHVAAPLAFGGLLVQAAGGRITLTCNGSLLPEGPGVLTSAAPLASYGRIHLTGPANGHFRLAIAPGNPVLGGSAGGAIALAAFQTSVPASGGRFDASGSADVAIGGTLDIPAFAPAGAYAAVANLQLYADGCAPVVQYLAVTCTVRSPLVLTTLAPLAFAGITPGSGGSFRLDPGGAWSAPQGGPRLVKGTPSPAAFRLTGPALTPYSILLPAEVPLAGPGGTIRMVDFTSDVVQGSLPPGGLVFHVGATLDLRADQPLGTYRGSFRITVVYP